MDKNLSENAPAETVFNNPDLDLVELSVVHERRRRHDPVLRVHAHLRPVTSYNKG
jgi:hypothetical protein